MVDFEYLQKGLWGLANAHRAGTMAGHLGAAVVAGYFFGEDQGGLDQRVFRGVEGELDRVMQGEEAIWFNARKAGITPQELFDPVAPEDTKPASLKPIASALEQIAGSLQQSGHDIIFASIALRALHDHPGYATAPVVDGIRKLTEAFKHQSEGRGYYGQKTGWLSGQQVTLESETQFPDYKHTRDMVQVTIDELIQTASTRKQGFGGLHHLINHAAAVTEIDRFGFPTIARKALAAHHRHVRLWRSLPNVEQELGPVTKSDIDPRNPEYWDGMLNRNSALLTHRIKTLYGYHTLRRFIEDDARRKLADDAFLFLMN
ncbi:hypothetical protein [Thalassoroseus pseudoceratinae]|uniref:hypothetical protein n=1 Tax=Thalassoroseus pseudoceratinae TaxID=2713176 RepID=UPI001422A3F7|nr:hypothetical protein [Thalassoroseus pseudoceratinae]